MGRKRKERREGREEGQENKTSYKHSLDSQGNRWSTTTIRKNVVNTFTEFVHPVYTIYTWQPLFTALGVLC